MKQELRLAVAVSQSFPRATFAQYVTNPLPQSEAQTALTGMFPLAIYRKKGAAGAGIVQGITKETFPGFVNICGCVFHSA